VRIERWYGVQPLVAAKARSCRSARGTRDHAADSAVIRRRMTRMWVRSVTLRVAER
jgi:hypothetical protein